MNTLLGDIVEVLKEFGHVGLVNYLVKADLIKELTAEGPYTLFAPSNSVFAQDGIKEYFESLSEEELTSLLLNHVVFGRISYDDIKDGQVLTTVHSAELTFGVDPDDGHKYIGVEDGVAIVEDADYVATNGLIHVIDWILFLPDSTATVPHHSSSTEDAPHSS